MIDIKNNKKIIKLIIICGSILLVIALFLFSNIIINNKLEKINNYFNVIIDNNSSLNDLQQAKENLKKIDINCSKEPKEKFIYYCSERDKYINYVEAKELYEKLTDDSSYDDYEKAYDHINQGYYYDSSNKVDQIFIAFNQQLKDKYLNFLIDEILKGTDKDFYTLSSRLSGYKYIEYYEPNKPNDKLYCFSYGDDDFGNILHLESGYSGKYFFKDEMNYIYTIEWSNIIFSEKTEIDKRILDIVSKELLDSNYSFDDEWLVYNPDKSKWTYPKNQAEYKKELIKRNKIRLTEKQCLELQENGNNANYNPAIGMTKNEVLKSLWGKPLKTNKTTTFYGTREQWVYSRNRYLYFNENGILTTIQE